MTDELIARGRYRVDTVPERDGRRFRGMLRVAAGDRVGFEADLAALSTFGDDLRSVFVQSLVAEWRALLVLLDGDLSGAEGLANRVLEVAGDDPNFLLGWFVQLAWIRVEQGWAAEVAPLASATLDEHPDVVALRALVALLRAEAGEPAAARELIEPLAASDWALVPDDWLRPAALAFLALPARETLGPGECRSLAGHLAEYSGQLIVVGAGALVPGAADHFRGVLLGALGPADRHAAGLALASAAALEERIGSRALTARSHLEHAAVLLGGGSADRRRAAHLLDSVRAEGECLGITRLVQRADDLRQHSGQSGRSVEPRLVGTRRRGP